MSSPCAAASGGGGASLGMFSTSQGDAEVTNFSSAAKEDDQVNDGSVGSFNINTPEMQPDRDGSDNEELLQVEGVIVHNKVMINGQIICDLLVSDNLNECVEALLKKQKPVRTDAMGVVLPQVMVRPKNSLRNKGKLRRIRKNSDQYKILNCEYIK